MKICNSETEQRIPNLQHISNDDIISLENVIDRYVEEQNFEELSKIATIYPFDANFLDGWKNSAGIEYLIQEKINLSKAVEQYGTEWLES